MALDIAALVSGAPEIEGLDMAALGIAALGTAAHLKPAFEQLAEQAHGEALLHGEKTVSGFASFGIVDFESADSVGVALGDIVPVAVDKPHLNVIGKQVSERWPEERIGAG